MHRRRINPRPGTAIFRFHASFQRKILNFNTARLRKVELPENIAESYLRVLFSPRTEKVLSKDIMDTIDTFFRKDLNLSDTARQLYIHRNTLVYRLDKVYRHTGLDLRKFDDAVTFRIFMELKKRRRKEEQER